jgi:hypothetical protein
LQLNSKSTLGVSAPGFGSSSLLCSAFVSLQSVLAGLTPIFTASEHRYAAIVCSSYVQIAARPPVLLIDGHNTEYSLLQRSLQGLRSCGGCRGRCSRWSGRSSWFEEAYEPKSWIGSRDLVRWERSQLFRPFADYASSSCPWPHPSTDSFVWSLEEFSETEHSCIAAVMQTAWWSCGMPVVNAPMQLPIQPSAVQSLGLDSGLWERAKGAQMARQACLSRLARVPDAVLMCQERILVHDLRTNGA